MNPDDAAELGLADGEMARVSSRRGTIVLAARVSHREAARQLLHPVPLPRGRGQPADHRRDRPGRQDPRVQVLRGADRGGPARRARSRRPRPVRTAGDGQAQERVPGVEARAGKFPGPSLIPALHAIQERVGWLPREELVALARDVRRPLYEIEGLISFYPHFRTDPPKRVALHACHDLSCWLQGADQRIAALRERYGAGRRRRGHRGVLHRPVRRGARGRGQRAPGRRPATPDRWSARPGPASCRARAPRSYARRPAVAQRPVRAGGGALRGAARACWPASWTPARSSRR